MEKLKISLIAPAGDALSEGLARRLAGDQALLEICTPTLRTAAEESGENTVSVLVPTAEPVKCPDGAVEIILTDQTNILPLNVEPTADDIVAIRLLLERDLDRRSPRILIASDKPLSNTELATQVTAEQGINTYGPYTAEQAASDDVAHHFDCIVTADASSTKRIVEALAGQTAVRFFAGRKEILTAPLSAAHPIEGEEEGLADISWLTRPVYAAIDIVRNRISYDEARADVLPKLFRDRREERRREAAAQASQNTENTEKAS